MRTKKIPDIRKLYAVMASDVKVRNGKNVKDGFLVFPRQDVA